MGRRMVHFLSQSLLVCLLCFVWTASGWAQINRANLNGTVTDPSGAIVPNAKVDVEAPDTGFTRQVTTGSSGVYSITSLPTGSYNLTISAPGFRSFVVRGVELFVGQTRTVNAQLELGAATTTVQVRGSVQALSTNNAEIATVIRPQQVEDIPLNGRDWATLMTLTAGAVNLGAGGQRDLRFGGEGIDDQNYTYDGIDATGVQEQSQKAGARLAISLESIAEFRVSSSVYTADQGGSMGAQVSVVSKTGTNEFHGSGFEFLRNSAFDARSPFDVNIPPFRLNQFGGSFGGPIKKNRTFFFADYEGLRQDLNTTLIGFVPNAAFRASAAAKSPALAPFLASWPVGQTPVDSVTDQYTSIGRNTQREDSGMFRVDHTFTEKTSIFARMNIDDAAINSPLDNLGGRDNPQVRPSNYVVQLTHVFSPTVVNELRGGINRSALHHYQFGTSPLSTANGQPGTVNVSVPSFDSPSNSTLDTEVGTTIDVYDDLTIVHGRHTIKAGIGLERHRLNNSSEGIANGQLSYSSDQDFVNNVLNDYAFFGQLTLGGNRRTYIMPYVQDTYKVRPNLTLNYGLRWEHYTVLKETFGRQAVVTPACGGFCPAGTPLYFPDYRDFAPRLGVAWIPGGSGGKTVIRAGFGILFEPDQMDDFSDAHESTAQRFDVSEAIVPNLSWPVALSLLPAPSYSPKAWNQNRRDGYTENWDFTVERQLPHSFLGQIAYDGSQGHKLFSATKTNLINPLTGTRPLTQFGQYNLKANLGNANFHSLQVSVERNLTAGWSWQTQYQWSHALSDNGFGAGEYPHIENMSCIKCDYSDSSHDVRHSLSVNSVYQLPFGPGRRFLNSAGPVGKVLGGWELSGIAGATSGLPVDIVVSRKARVMPDGNSANQRPNYISGASLYPADQTTKDWFNAAAFAVPAPDTWGNLGRYIGRGPSHFEVDTALEKRTTLTERLAIEFRAEAFNIFNRPQYGNPGANISSSSFGVITTQLNSGATGTGTSRRIQFMLRLEF